MHTELNKIQSVFVKQHNGRLLIKLPKECIYKLNELNLTSVYCHHEAGNYYMDIANFSEPEIIHVFTNIPIESDKFH
jgi:hypothetical protein